MSQHDYNAIGRCKVLKKEIDCLTQKRDEVLQKISDGLKPIKETNRYEIKKYDLGLNKTRLEEVEELDQKLESLVIEYNNFSADAGERQLRII